MSANGRCFLTGCRLHHLRQVGHIQLSVTRPKRVRLTRAHAFAVRGYSPPRLHFGGDRPASQVRLPSPEGPPLHGERPITMTDSFQSAKRTRLGLAHQRRKDQKIESISNCSRHTSPIRFWLRLRHFGIHLSFASLRLCAFALFSFPPSSRRAWQPQGSTSQALLIQYFVQFPSVGLGVVPKSRLQSS